MKKIVSNAVNLSVSLIISAVILYFVYRDYDFSQFWASVAEIKVGWLCAALLFSIMGPLLRGVRWNLLLDPIGYRVPQRDAVLTVFTGYAANIIIPRIGEICRCAILDRNNKVPFIKSCGTLVAERFVDFILLVLITLSTVIIQYDKFAALFSGQAGISSDSASSAIEEAAGSTPLLQTTGFWLWTAGGIILIAVIWILCRKTGLWKRIIGWAKDFWTGFAAIRQVKNLPLFLIYSIGIWVCYYLEMYLAFFCISSIAEVGAMAGLVCFVAGSIAVLVPTPNGAGPWHFAITSMLVIYGVALADAQTFALVLHTAQTATYLICGALAWIALPRHTTVQ